MQCPSCGWENIPGTRQCCVCSAGLDEKPEKTALRPPRARDRSLWQRLMWSVSANPLIFRISERFYDRARHSKLPRPAWGLPEVGLLLLSTIPGFAHTVLLRLPRLGLLILGATLAATALAALLYRTPVCDMLLWGVISISIYGVVAAVEHLRGDAGGGPAQSLRRVGVTLMVLCLYLLFYTGLRFALSPYVQIAGIGQTPEGSNLNAGDRILLQSLDRISRGDVVLATSPNQGTATLTPVIGLPGETIEIRERIYINGRPYGERLEFPDELDMASQERHSVRLAGGQYWVRANFVGHPPEDYFFREMLEAGVVNRENIWGRAIAVIGPPAHRRWIREDEGQ